MQQGGVVLWAIVLLSIILYGLLAATWWGVSGLEKEIAHYRPLGAVSSLASGEDGEKMLGAEVGIFALDRLAWVQRRLPMIAVLVAAEPLAGLLGTVAGMMMTFFGMAHQATGQPIDGISTGVSAAMITTQAGLIMAIPAAIGLALLRHRVRGLSGALEKIESQSLQVLKGGRA